MSTDDELSRAEITERITQARSLIQEVRDDAAIPVVAHSAHLADMHCHRLMWEMGAESATTPEIEDPVDVGGDD